MGKTKKKANIRQQRIPGSIDVPTDKVLRKAEQYVEILHQRMGAQVDENALRTELIEVMKAATIDVFELDGHTVSLTHSESDKITVKKLSGDTDGD
ncbi:MAG: hypothetical protein V3U39_12290 [Acidimicrobiia bacterium]